MFSINIMKHRKIMKIFPNPTYFNLGKRKHVDTVQSVHLTIFSKDQAQRDRPIVLALGM